jgi:hypothetical protein
MPLARRKTYIEGLWDVDNLDVKPIVNRNGSVSRIWILPMQARHQ